MKLLPHLHTQLIIQAIHAAQTAGDLPAFEIPVISVKPSDKAGQGDYASPIAMGLSKLAGKKPRDIAETIVKYLPATDFIDKVEIAGPGFINFTLNPAYLKQQVDAILNENDALFTLDIGAGKRAQVEFVSANPTGPLTVGRSRGGIVGDTMARLLEAAGFAVEREYYFNNAGNQMMMLGKSLQARYLQALGQTVDLPEGGYQGEYLVEFAQELVAEKSDGLANADWQTFKDYAEKKMFAWIKRTLARVDIHHDVFFNEDSLLHNGSVEGVLEALKTNGYVYTSVERENAAETHQEKRATGTKPAVWFRSTALGDSEDRVLVKSDGIPTYTLPDIAYHKNKLDRGFDLLINILGADHGTQYKVVQYGVQALGMDPSKIQVILNQMVRFIKDGEFVKGSTRRGVFETLDDLIEETSADAIRYHLLARSANSQMDFDLDAVVKQSNDNPVYYIQNAHVRCCGILREAEARGFNDHEADLSLLGEDELSFIRKALELGEVIEIAVSQYEPHRIAFYAHEMASAFHPIYDRVRVLHTEVPEDVAKARLRFYRAAQVCFRRVLRLMGMTAPERM